MGDDDEKINHLKKKQITFSKVELLGMLWGPSGGDGVRMAPQQVDSNEIYGKTKKRNSFVCGNLTVWLRIDSH